MKTKLPVGIIGLGRMGRIYAKHLATSSKAQIIGVSGVVESKTEKFAEEFDSKYWSTDFYTILDNSDIKAVFIASPTNTHTQIIIAAAKAGKAIFCEKPIALTLEETNEIISVLEKSCTFLQVGFMRRFDPGYMEAKKQIDAGKIGKPVTFKSIGRDPFCPPLEYADPKVSGGLILDMAIHDFDLARWLMGTEIRRVYCEGGTLAFSQLNEVGDIDNAVINILFENNSIGNVEVSRNAVYGYDIRTEILGTKGGLNIGYYRQTPLLILSNTGITYDMVPYLHERFGEAYLNQVEDFLDRVINDKKPAVDIYDARSALAIALAANRSYNDSIPIDLNYY
ncbi:MAG: inositol 2-dehydrogenase [Candidatus Neomarinimicrobiota bacterium]